MNGKEIKIIWLILEEMGHKYPKTPVHCDNKTATMIANDTVQKHRSRLIEMRYFWVTDQVHTQKSLGHNMAVRSRKLSGLFFKTSFGSAPQEDTALVNSYTKFTEIALKSKSPKGSERVCWNPRTRVP